VVRTVKGRTTCPQCSHEFLLDLTDDGKKHEITCPKCKHKYMIKAKHCDPNKECTWEEHGEPRKTILSAIKPKTNKPFFIMILLICVVVIGFSTAFFSEYFIESSLDTADALGMRGSVKFDLYDLDNDTVNNAIITINGDVVNFKGNGIYIKDDIDLGIQKVIISKSGYKTQEIEILVTPLFKSAHEISMQTGDSTDVINNDFDTVGCSIIIIIFTVLAFIALISTFKKQHFDLALVGSFIGIFTFGFFFIGSILSIIAFILIILSRDEFQNGEKGKIF